MVISHNMLAANAGRQLKLTTDNKRKSSEKLSTGYRINRSSDDAAGLSMSEKMRWQVRGLERGKNNIGEGIDLIKTADGALGEVHDILQRVRELSVQAYNDTNTELDRDAIQGEVDQILTEINRIADTTSYNTKLLLKGNPIETIQITEDHTVDRIARMTLQKDKPDWLSVDKNLIVHPGYTQTQDTTGVMYQHGSVTDPFDYYGPKENCPEGFDFKGEWTDSINNNPSSKMDFTGFANLSPADVLNLYGSMFELIGTKISFPCGTCSSQVNSIFYDGNEGELATAGVENIAYNDVSGNIDLSGTSFPYNGKVYSGYFEAIRELTDTYGGNHDPASTTQVPGEEAAVKALAGSIAKDLRDKTFHVLESNMTDHFDRVVKGNDDYSLIVYDYRDDSALTNMHAADTEVKTSAQVRFRVTTKALEPGVIVDTEAPMNIMCGALKSSYIPIELSDISLGEIGLSGYKVNRYGKIASYNPEYLKKLVDWENNSVSEQVVKRMETVQVVDKMIPAVYGWVNGENKMIQPPAFTYKTEQREKTEVIRTRNPANPPAAGPGDVTYRTNYTPDSLELVDRAIGMVSDFRSRLGATQNRLEHAYMINANSAENSDAAESRIRDTDMAKEMVNFAKHDILEQAGQSMLAQANQSPQGVLRLLS